MPRHEPCIILYSKFVCLLCFIPKTFNLFSKFTKLKHKNTKGNKFSLIKIKISHTYMLCFVLYINLCFPLLLSVFSVIYNTKKDRSNLFLIVFYYNIYIENTCLRIHEVFCPFRVSCLFVILLLHIVSIYI